MTGPVVTPALSQATLTNSSVEKIVRITPRPYNGSKTFIKSKSRTTFETPSAIPTATPPATLYISIDFLKAPFVRFSTVIPRAFNAGSANVAPNPRMKAKPITTINPTVKPNIGDVALIGNFMKAAGSTPPV